MSGPLLPSEILSKAADLVEPEGAWTKFVAAGSEPATDEEDIDGVEVNEWSPNATCWCAAGSIWRVTPRLPEASVVSVRSRALDYLRDVVGGPIPDWNDATERTQAEVVAGLRAAAELAKAEGQ